MTRAGPALRFLAAARQSELLALEQLARISDFVALLSELVHALQKERGYSNLYLCLRQDTLLTHLGGLCDAADECERAVRGFLDGMEQEGGKARLYDAIAYALYRLDELPDLRWRVRRQRIDAEAASAAYTRLISSLLAVVFEAADASLDAGITRLLVALLNFMQGKELAGQERALGVTGYAAGYFDEARQARLDGLVGDQQRSFDTFERHAPSGIQRAWRQARRHDAAVARMRDMARRTGERHPVDPALGAVWFDVCTARIDAMRPIASGLTDLLAEECRQRIGQTRRDLRNHGLLRERLEKQARGMAPAMLFSVQGRALNAPPPGGVGGEIERSILDILQAQREQMQKADEALAQARAALDDQKDLLRAKRLLMRTRRLSEPDAHAWLQRAAMQSGRTLIDVARQVLAAAG